MNRPSLEKFQERIKFNGLLVLNSSLVDPREITRKDIESIAIPVTAIATQEGNAKLANMVVLGAYLEKTAIVAQASIEAAFADVLDGRYHHLIPANLEAMEKGREFVRR